MAQTIRTISYSLPLNIIFSSCFFFFVCLVQLRLCCYCPKQRRRKKNWFKRMYNKYITMTWSARKRGEMERRNTSFMKNCARLIRCKFLESVILIDTDRLTAIDRSIEEKCILNLQWLSFVHLFAPEHCIVITYTHSFSFIFFSSEHHILLLFASSDQLLCTN